MRIVVVATVVSVTLGACAAPKFVPPAGLSARQEASDRAHCDKVGAASRNDPRMKEYVEQQVGANMVGAFIGGPISLAVAAAQQDQTRENWAKVWVIRHTQECLKKKGYKVEGS